MKQQAKLLQGKENTTAPWDIPPVSYTEAQAIQALAQGKANQDQQLAFIKWLEKFTAVGEMTYRQNPGDAAFAEGKRWVGRQFFSLAKAHLTQDPRQG